ncbi:MAG: hypothetical protein R3Y23_05630, partial [Bacillota bacterium]
VKSAGYTVVLMNDISSEDALVINYPVNILLSGYTLTVDSFTMYSDDYATVDIENGKIIATTGDISIQIPNGTINLSDDVFGIDEDSAIIMDASTSTINIMGATQFYTIDGSNEISTATTANILANTRVVISTDSSVSLAAKNSEGTAQSDVTVEDSMLDTTTDLTDEETSFIGSTVVTTASEFATAVMNEQGILLGSDLSINTCSVYNSTFLYILMETYGLNIDLNGFTMSVETTYKEIHVAESASFIIQNGNLEVIDNSGTTGNYPGIYILENAELTFNNVDYTTYGAAGSGIYVNGPNATVNVIESSITAPYYCVTTNASATNGLVNSYGLVMNYTNSTFTTTDAAGIPVFINVPGVLTMDGCTVNSENTGVLVRGGEAYIYNTVINCNAVAEEDYLSESWTDGTGVPNAGIVIGNRTSGSYTYDSVCELKNVTVNMTGTCDIEVYIWGSSDDAKCSSSTGEVYDAANRKAITTTFNYTNCDFETIYVGGVNVTINDDEVEDISSTQTEAIIYTADTSANDDD